MSYNIKGLSNKQNNTDFFEFITSFDIFLLSEASVLKKDIAKFEHLFNGFVLYWDVAIKEW